MPTAKAKMIEKIRQNKILGSLPINFNEVPNPLLLNAFNVKKANAKASNADRATITFRASQGNGRKSVTTTACGNFFNIPTRLGSNSPKSYPDPSSTCDICVNHPLVVAAV